MKLTNEVGSNESNGKASLGEVLDSSNKLRTFFKIIYKILTQQWKITINKLT